MSISGFMSRASKFVPVTKPLVRSLLEKKKSEKEKDDYFVVGSDRRAFLVNCVVIIICCGVGDPRSWCVL